ncbi:dnaJ homolog subfamily C member 4 isoform X3 [Sorex araneus]|uniref:dnaJ homolog subfamily C member 4 isoform X3 n=1 Tax=Sorex araneus TaxID=42254 RepID=UPI00243385E1|nr:dnaJ homolog subfamily C member 4 isoform X3 [Sorex araneus]
MSTCLTGGGWARKPAKDPGACSQAARLQGSRPGSRGWGRDADGQWMDEGGTFARSFRRGGVVRLSQSERGGGASPASGNGGGRGVPARLPPCCPCASARGGRATLPAGSSRRLPGSGLAPATTMNYWGCTLVPALKKLNELSSLNPKSRFVELSEAYQVLSHAESRRNYDLQLRSATAPTPGASGPRGAAHQAYRGAWEDPNSRYWAQFRGVRPQGPEERRRQQKLNQRVMGYCLLVMLAGMGLHYVAFRKLEQMHRSFMDEKDRIITAIYNEARARAKKARLQKEPPQNQQPPPGPVPGPEVVRPGSSP